MKKLAVVAVGSLMTFLFLHGCGSSDAGPSGTGDGVDASVPDDDASTQTCGNGAVEGGEECDQGSQNSATGVCSKDCKWACIPGNATRGDTFCDDKDPCNGTETCGATHACTPGTPLASGAACGTGKVCNANKCTDAVCGDKIVTAPEECDEGNANGTGGCDKACHFTCISTDTTRSCASLDSCTANGTCDDAKHTCTAGAPKADGTACTSGTTAGACKGGACVAASCGDGVTTAPEQCDFGTANGAGTGCELNCTFSCTKAPESCVTVDACGGKNACATVTVSGASGQKCVVGTPPAAGTACGTGGTCQGNVCVTATCGNGTLDAGEQCDFGTAGNGAGKGCESNCTFSCQASPDSCPNTDRCGAAPQACTAMTGPNGIAGKQCKATTTLAACAACGTGGVCVSGACKTSVCGDKCVDPAKGETCDAPNGGTCNAQCHLCGDGKRQDQEQCDDGNNTNMDGCDSSCTFEQVHRANSASLKFAADTFCTANALGGAIKAVAQGTIGDSLTAAVKDGSTTIEFKFLGLTDLTGTGQASGLKLGALTGVPATATGKTYNGNSDLDWWYATSAGSVDATRTPKSILSAALSSKALTASGSMDLSITLAGSIAALHLSGGQLRANVGNTSKPTASSDKLTPGHLATENLDPALTSFDTMSNGQLCGNISAASLRTVPIPTALTTGIGKCSENYDPASNSLLDAIVNGCKVLGGLASAIDATPKPDKVDPSVPAAGAGAPYTLTKTGNKVTGCTDKNAAAVDFDTCLKAAAYSSYFVFTSDRVIAR